MVHKYCCYMSYVYKYVEEYLDSFIDELGLNKLVIDREQHVFSEKNIYVFIQTVATAVIHFNKNIFLINIEQLTRENYKKYILDCLSHKIKIFDYSVENIRHINRDNKISWLPYQINDTEINKLKNHNMVEKKYDVAFVGTISPKRKKILEQLKEKGYNVLEIHAFGDERDKYIGSAKILLNVHYANDYHIHETFRCDRYIFSDMIVVSESSVHDDLLDTSDLTIFADYDKLVDKIGDILNYYDFYHNDLVSKNKILLKHIQKDRRNKFLYFKTMINDAISGNIFINKFADNTLEIFSAAWEDTTIGIGFIKFCQQKIILQRGFNIFGIKNKKIFLLGVYDTWAIDYSQNIQKFLYEMYTKKNYDFLLIATHDDATSRINTSILQSYLIFLSCSQLINLQYRGNYVFVYDLNCRKIITETSSNNYSIHEWYELIKNKNDGNILKNLGMPIYIIPQGELLAIKNTVNQIEKYSKNIHIIDTCTSNDNLFSEYYDTQYNYFLEKINVDFNFPLTKQQIQYNFPHIFAITTANSKFDLTMPLDFTDLFKKYTSDSDKGTISVTHDEQNDSNVQFYVINKKFFKKDQISCIIADQIK